MSRPLAPIPPHERSGLLTPICNTSVNEALCSLAKTTLESILGDNVLVAPNPATASGAQAVNRSSVASLAFLVWDILITTDDEIKLMWPRSWSSTKALYFFVRYFAVAVQVSILFVGTEISQPFNYTPHACFAWQVWQGVAALVLGVAVDVILILRLHAMYNRSRWVMICLACLFLGEVIGMCVSLGRGVSGIKFDDNCTVTSWPIEFVAYGAFPLVFQGILFGFTVFQLIKTLRSGWGRTRVLEVLMRDGIWAFFLIFFVYLLQGVVFLLPGDATGVFYAWLLTAFSFSGYRLLLNIQRLAPQHSRTYVGTTRRSTQLTSTRMEFTSHITAADYLRSAPDPSELDSETLAGISGVTSPVSPTTAYDGNSLIEDELEFRSPDDDIEMLPPAPAKRSVAFDPEEGGSGADRRHLGRRYSYREGSAVRPDWDNWDNMSPQPHR